MTNKHRAVLLKYATRSQPSKTATPGGFDWEKTPFYDEAKTVVLRHFSTTGNSSEAHERMKASWTANVESVVGVALTLFCFERWCRGDVAAIYYFPVVYWIVCSNLMHNGSHFAQSRNPLINTLCAHFGYFHVNYYLWAVQHVIGHHCHTNILTKDPDLDHFTHVKAEEKYVPGYRSHPAQEYLPKYYTLWKFAQVFQSFASSVALALLNVPMYVTDGVMMTTPIHKKFIKPIILDRLVVVALMGVCVYYHGLGRALFMCFHSWGAHGVCFYIFSQISHTNDDCINAVERYKAENKLDKVEWAVHEMLTATDYNCESWFWCTVSVNLNNQMIHHLFPSIHPCHYPALRRKLLPVAAKYGIDYEGRSSYNFLSLLIVFTKWIYSLNEKRRKDYKPIIGTVSESNFWSGVALAALWVVYVGIPYYYYVF